MADIEGTNATILSLQTALEDAIEGLKEALPYVEDYFVDKWDLTGYVLRAQMALDKSKGETND